MLLPMRSTLGAALLLALAFLVCVAPLHSQSGELELAPRHGPFPKAFLKGCAKLSATAVDFDGSGNRFQVEWWRCGSRAPNRRTGAFPVHYVLIRPPAGKSPALGVTLSNAGNSDDYFIDRLQLIDVPLSSRQLLLVSARHYEDQQGKIDCILGRVADHLECSPSPEPQYSAQQELRPREKSFLRKLDEYISQ
jgi:hypothetical protein